MSDYFIKHNPRRRLSIIVFIGNKAYNVRKYRIKREEGRERERNEVGGPVMDSVSSVLMILVFILNSVERIKLFIYLF